MDLLIICTVFMERQVIGMLQINKIIQVRCNVLLTGNCAHTTNILYTKSTVTNTGINQENSTFLFSSMVGLKNAKQVKTRRLVDRI